MAIEFDGSTQYLISELNSLSIAMPIAISGWFFYDTFHGGEMLSIGRDASNDRLTVRTVGSGTIRATHRGASVESSVDATTTAPRNFWHHVLCVFVSTTDRKIWLNGGNEGTDVTSIAAPVIEELTIGVRTTENTSFFNGLLAEFAVWSGADTASMSVADAAILASGFTPPCLSRLAHELELYQPLIRDANWNSVGVTMTPVGSPTVGDHVPVINPFVDNSIRAAGAGSAGRVQAQGIIPFGLNFER